MSFSTETARAVERASDAIIDTAKKVDRTIIALERIAKALELQALCEVATRCAGVSGNIKYEVLLDRAEDILHPVKPKAGGNTPYRGDQ